MFKYFRVLIFNYLKVCPGDELKEGLLRIPFDLPDLKDEMYNQVISEKIEFKNKDEELPIQMILIKNFEIKYFKFNTI